MTGVNHRDMNTKNKYVILKALATQGAMPRNELSMLSGLSKMAVTAIANEYMEQGVLRECGELSSSGGRKPKLLNWIRMGSLHCRYRLTGKCFWWAS